MGARVKKLNGRAEKKKAGQQQKPREKIEAAFYKLNPTHVIHPSKLGLIIVIGGILRGALPADDRAASGAEKNLRIIGSAMPRSPGCSLNTASKEIANLQAVAKKLKKALSTMHAPTIFSMLHAGVHIEKFEETLNVIIGDIDKTKEALEQLKKKEASGQLKKDYPEWASKKLGRPKKEGALHIAEILAD